LFIVENVNLQIWVTEKEAPKRGDESERGEGKDKRRNWKDPLEMEALRGGGVIKRRI